MKYSESSRYPRLVDQSHGTQRRKLGKTTRVLRLCSLERLSEEEKLHVAVAFAFGKRGTGETRESMTRVTHPWSVFPSGQELFSFAIHVSTHIFPKTRWPQQTSRARRHSADDMWRWWIGELGCHSNRTEETRVHTSSAVRGT